MSTFQNHQDVSLHGPRVRGNGQSATLARRASIRLANVSAVACASALALSAMVYTSPACSEPLPGPRASADVGDVRAVAGQLRRLGLRVQVRENTDFAGRQRAFLDFGTKAGHRDGPGELYYGSRSVQMDEGNGAITVRAPSGFPIDAVGLSDMLGQIRQAHGQIRVVALDACPNEAAGRRLSSSLSHCLAFVIVPADSPVSPTEYATGLLRIRVEPSAANVRIDDSDFGNGPQVHASLPAGVHRIVVSDRDYGSTTRDIQVTPGSASDVQMTLAVRRFASATPALLPPP